MLIRSKLTKLEHTVTAAGWEKIKARGDGPKYVVLSNDNARVSKPTEVKTETKTKATKPTTSTEGKKTISTEEAGGDLME